MSTLNIYHWKNQMYRIPFSYRKHVKLIMNGLHNISCNIKRHRILEKIARRGDDSSGNFEVGFFYQVGQGAKEKRFNNKLSAAAQLCSWLNGLGHSPVELWGK